MDEEKRVRVNDTLEALKKEFDPLSVSAIEAKIQNTQEAIVEGRRQVIRALHYLDHTQRYRENSRYKKATFEQYLSEMFNIRTGTYEMEKKIYLNFYQEAKMIGPGVVGETIRKCGVENVPIVAREIVKKAERTRRGEPSREQIDQVIAVYAKPEPEAEARLSYFDLARMLEDEKAAHSITRQALKELQEQNDKLKAALARYERMEQRARKIFSPIEIQLPA